MVLPLESIADKREDMFFERKKKKEKKGEVSGVPTWEEERGSGRVGKQFLMAMGY